MFCCCYCIQDKHLAHYMQAVVSHVNHHHTGQRMHGQWSTHFPISTRFPIFTSQSLPLSHQPTFPPNPLPHPPLPATSTMDVTESPSDQQLCPMLAYQFVCGADNVTYDNECVLTRANVQLASRGACVGYPVPTSAGMLV